MKKLIALILVAVFAFSLVACGGGVSVDTSSPEGAVKTMLKAMANADVDAMIECSVAFNSELVKNYSTLDAEAKATLIEEIKADEALLKGNSAKVSISIESVKLNEDAEIGDIEAKILEEYGLDKVIEDSAVVSFKVTMSAGGQTQSSEDKYSCVKIGGNWYVIA